MNASPENIEILLPKKQLYLFGYQNYFNSFIKLFHKNKLPNTILLSGQKGSGKATFAYHLINYLLSYNEKDKYSLENFTINPDNKSYKDLTPKQIEIIHQNYSRVVREIKDEEPEYMSAKEHLPGLKSIFKGEIKLWIGLASDKKKSKWTKRKPEFKKIYI